MMSVWNIKGGSKMGMWKTIGERLGRPPRHCQLRWVKRLAKKEEATEDIMKQEEEETPATQEAASNAAGAAAGAGGGGAGKKRVRPSGQESKV
jgi:hypothetical protein